MKDSLNTMEIQLESPDPHAVQSYTDTSITVNGVLYQNSIIISKDTIQTAWPVHSVLELCEKNITPLLDHNPEIILIGHSEVGKQIPISVVSFLANRRIGIECMTMGAACRTFNVLLSESRAVVLGYVMYFCSNPNHLESR
ncbi:MAG: MTH938/NDUFAF3 family protein [Legionellaceae bacterium]|nr:MTH938/NDUFAF3 family protein [Legionellaceae bacterium]